MSKYVTVKSQGIITRIAEETDIPGYTIGILEPFFPSEFELSTWSRKREREWVKRNNKMLTEVCNFLNKKGEKE